MTTHVRVARDLNQPADVEVIVTEQHIDDEGEAHDAEKAPIVLAHDGAPVDLLLHSGVQFTITEAREDGKG